MKLTWSITIFLLVACPLVANDIDAARYILKRYDRPVTFLKVGMDRECIIPRLGRHYRGAFVLIDGYQYEWSQGSIPKNCIHLGRNYSPELLQRLFDSEHFDIVLFADHHLPISEETMPLYLASGEHVIIRTNDTSEGVLALLLHHGFKPLPTAEGSDEVYMHKHSPRNYTKRTFWYEEDGNIPEAREIVSNYTEKHLIKKYGPRPIISDWLPGINLVSFRMFGGDYPTPSIMRREILRLIQIPHPDFMPNNIIIQGESMTMIDLEDSNIGPGQSRTVLTDNFIQLLIDFVSEKDPQKVPHIFEKALEYSREYVHGKPK
ncbi:MAG: hypothetical protein S4CHLAM102_07500 [Chlamydiia bacterium]|nr:hypothetical protein [Chlamydiia bacterium]